jgi:hypothetical protein
MRQPVFHVIGGAARQTGRHVPQTRLDATGGGEGAAVRAERYCVDSAFVFDRVATGLTSRRVPQTRLVATGGGERAAVRAERDHTNRPNANSNELRHRVAGRTLT